MSADGLPDVHTRLALADDADLLRDMLVAAVNWAPGRDVPREAVLADPHTAHYVNGWPRRGDLGVVAVTALEISRRQPMPVGAAWLRYFTEDDLARIEAKGGVLQELTKLKDQKLTRFIGITSHTDPTVLKTALERHDFDCTQMALNGALVGMKSGTGGMVPNPAMKTSFETVALPVANRKKIGVIAMKVFAQDALTGDAAVEKLLYYSLSLPVTTAVVGMPKVEQIEKNVQLAKAFRPLPKTEMEELSRRLSEKNKAALDLFFSNHVDA